VKPKKPNKKGISEEDDESDFDPMEQDDDYESEAPKATAARSLATTKGSSKSKSIEEIYQKKTQLEHILLRPDTYIGSTEAITQHMWVWDSVGNSMVFREISFVPGFYKIFDEILVNAADNKVF
jgi:DNA topoisomerase-2